MKLGIGGGGRGMLNPPSPCPVAMLTWNVKSALALPCCNAYLHLVSIFILLESCTKMPSNIVSIDEMLTSGQVANTTRVSYLAFFSFFKS